MTGVIRIPVPDASDPSDVTEALQIAAALWDRGDPDGAVRWVRRAVEAADEAGAPLRTAALARASAELAESARTAPSAAAASASSVSTSSTLRPRPHAVKASTPMPPRSSKPAPPKPPPSKPAPQRPPTSKPCSPSPRTVRSAPAPREVRPTIRVSVRSAAIDPSLLVVRALADGQAPPAGAREAWLTMTAADVDATIRNGRRVL